MAEEAQVFAAEQVVLAQKAQRSAQIVQRLRKSAAGAPLAFIAAGVVEGKDTLAGSLKITDLRAVVAGTVSQPCGHDDQRFALAEEITLQGFSAAFKRNPAVGAAEVLRFRRIVTTKTAFIDKNRQQQKQQHGTRLLLAQYARR